MHLSPLKTITARLLLCMVFALGSVAPCLAQRDLSGADQRFTADILKTTLFARTAEDRQFCDYVIQKRDDGTIPSRLIYGVYQKAMTRDRNKRFAYFRSGLEITCKREGIVLNPTQTKTSPAAPSFVPPVFNGFFNSPFL